MAILPPRTFSIKAISERIEPVSVGEGTGYPPDIIKVLTPSSSRAFALASTASTCRVTPSVPRSPPTVVTPERMSFERGRGGTCEENPASPPPPVMWTCASMNPGTAKSPLPSICCTGSSHSGMEIFCAMAAMRSLMIRISLVPRGSGEKTEALRIRIVAMMFSFGRSRRLFRGGGLGIDA